MKATDIDWSSGWGPEVARPMLSLVLAIAGRTVAVGDLEGPGVEQIRSRT
ncbi:MAG TPA: hypothetical protein VL984_02715 [Acidimicrobiales bacterium]|nr:hypothetical protein [Acidimicrobiales bacterium]